MAVVGLLALVGMAFGGVHHGTRVVVHLALVLGLAVAAFRSPDALAKAKGGYSLLFATFAILTATTISWAAARLLGTDGPMGGVQGERGLDAATHVLLGASTLWLAWAAAPTGTALRSAHRQWLVLGAVLLAFAASHVALGADAWLGLVAPSGPGGRIVPPFVNPNHSAAALLLFFPLAFDHALTSTQFSRQIAYGLLASVIAVALIWVGATAPILALGAQIVVIAAISWRPLAWIGLAISPIGIWGAIVWGTESGSNAVNSGSMRLEMWRASLELFLQSPVFGVGPGAYEIAIQPLRDDGRFLAWGHAHNDGLQWVVETGVFGGFMALLAFLALIPIRLRPSRTLRQLLVGLLGIALFSLVDFPFQMPFFLMVGATILGWISASAGRGSPPVWVTRSALLALILFNVAGGMWQTRSWVVQHAVQRLLLNPHDHGSIALLRRLAPWRSEADQALLRQALESHDERSIQAAIDALTAFQDDPTAARLAGGAALRHGSPAQAQMFAEKAVLLAPWDHRNWRLRALAHSKEGGAQAAQAWADAYAAGVPRSLEAGWEVLPVGLFWADAVQGQAFGKHIEVAAFLAKKGEPEAALIAYQAAAQAEPDRMVRSHVLLLEEMGEYNLMADHLEHYLTAHPEDVWATARLATAYEALGQWSDAKSSWLRHWDIGAWGLGRAAVAESRLADIGAAQKLWETQALLGRRPLANDYVPYAKLHHDEGDYAACLKLLAAPGVLDDTKIGAEARRLRTSCQNPR